MTVISIVGIAPRIGKTAVAELLLGRLKGWHVARVRVAGEIAEADRPRLSDAGHTLISRSEEAAADPDLRRLLDAGAAGASLLLADPRGLEEGLAAMLRGLPPGADLLVEGNAFLWARQANLAIMVIGPGPSGKGLARARPSVRELFAKVGLWAWNSRGNPTEEGFFEFPQALAGMGFHGAIDNRADFHHVSPTRSGDPGNRGFLEIVVRWVEHERSGAGGLSGRRGPDETRHL